MKTPTMMMTALTMALMLAPSLSGAQAHPPVSKEQRTKMAEMHTQMAACLNSDKDIRDCHSQMKASCDQQGMGDMCGMGMGMGMGRGHGGMMKHKGMMGAPKAEEKK